LIGPYWACGERDDDAVSRAQLRDLGADLLHEAHRFVAEDVAGMHERAHDLVEVEIRAADRARGDPHDRVSRALDRRIRVLVDAHIPPAAPGSCLHAGGCSARNLS